MKVLYLMDQIHTHGGGEKILSKKLNFLANNTQHEVFLLTTEQANKPEVYSISEKVIRRDISINYYRHKSYFHPLNLLKSLKHFFSLRKEIKRIQPDIIISVSQSPDQYFLPFLKRNIPKVKEFHSSGYTYSKPTSIVEKFKYRLFLIYRKYHALVVLNKDEKKYYPFNNICAIPNFIETRPLDVLQNNIRKNIIIAAGRIAPVKQFDHLIVCWSKISHEFPEWEVHIFGDGDETLTRNLKDIIKSLQLDRIYLKGPTSTLQEKMQKASIFAMTSATECFPMVLLEAQLAGLAIITYDCPHGPRSIIKQNVSGVLTPHNDMDAYATELKKLLNNENRRNVLSDQSVLLVSQYDEKNVMKLWLNLFNDLVNV